MNWYEDEVRQLEKTKVRVAVPQNAVVFYGSSTFRLWETLVSDLASPRILNLAFGGSTLEACVYFFERLVIPVKPCSLVVYAGDNDLGDGRSAADLLGYFRALTAKIERSLNGIEFAFLSIKPSPARLAIIDRIRLTNQLIGDEIKSTGNGYFIDVFDSMLGADGLPVREFFTEDGLHMSPAGYRLWTKLLFPYRNRIFTKNCSAVKTERVTLVRS